MSQITAYQHWEFWVCKVTRDKSYQINVVEWKHKVAENGDTKTPQNCTTLLCSCATILNDECSLCMYLFCICCTNVLSLCVTVRWWTGSRSWAVGADTGWMWFQNSINSLLVWDKEPLKAGDEGVDTATKDQLKLVIFKSSSDLRTKQKLFTMDTESKQFWIPMLACKARSNTCKESM